MPASARSRKRRQRQHGILGNGGASVASSSLARVPPETRRPLAGSNHWTASRGPFNAESCNAIGRAAGK